MAAKRLTLLALAVLAGCGGDKGNTASADSLTRDLQLMPTDSSAPLNDQPAASDAPAAAPAPAPAPKPRAKPAPAAPAAPATLTLTAGTTFGTTVDKEISSKTNKAGETVTATVSSNVVDKRGRVVIPAGSKVTLAIAELHESENKGDPGKLTLTPTQVTIKGASYDLSGSADALDRKLQDRKTNAGDVAKVGAGTAVGAVAGRVIGGSGKGAVIGGIIGGAVGAQRAVQTQDRDVVVPADSRVEITLDGPLTR